MKIRLLKDAFCGEVAVHSGEYWVALRHETKQIALVAGGRDILIPATRRSPKCRSKTLNISYFPGGGPIWSLVILDPKTGEWVAFLDTNPKRKK